MKTFFSSKTLIALAVAVAASAAYPSLANEQPIPPPAIDSALPAGIAPGSPVADVVKLVQASVEASVVQTYIANCPSAFNLDAASILALTDAGVPTSVVDAMLNHDKNLTATQNPAPAPANNTYSPEPTTAPPATEVNVTYFQENLSPYGNWVEVEGYGRCWRPTVVVYDSTWRPYCDRGHWVYTDCGWYWDSDYSWGVTFHYGRWFNHPRFGWCWWPDTVWAPSWVTWRSGGEYCGWAPLPPLSVYRPGIGFFYRGAGVSVGFDFGLGADCFTFVSAEHFCDRRPRYYREDHERVTQIFNQTTVINNYNVRNQTVINGGISVDRINTVSHRPIQAVAVAEIPNARRHGWHADDNRPGQRSGNDNAGRNNFSAPQNQRDAGGRDNHNNDSRAPQGGQHSIVTPGIHQASPGVQPVSPNRNWNGNSPVRPDENRSNQHDRDSGNRNGNQPSATPNATPPANNHPANGSPRQNSVSPGFVPQPSPAPAVRQPDRQTAIPSANRQLNNQDGSPYSRNDAREQQRSFNPPPASAPPQPAPPQIEQRHFAAPAAPSYSQPPQHNDSAPPRQTGSENNARNYAPAPSGPTQSNHNDSNKDKSGDWKNH
jgi:hypothetical protein